MTAFLYLNLNLFVFLTHAIEGIIIETGGEWENYPQIIFDAAAVAFANATILGSFFSASGRQSE